MKNLLLLLLLASFSATAADVRLTTINASHHFMNHANNETHNGIGVEYKIDDTWYGVNYFNNSLGNESVFTYANFERKSRLMDYGLFIGGASGYNEKLKIIGGVGLNIGYGRIVINPVMVGVGLVFDL